MSNAQTKEFVLTDYAKNLIEFKARQLSRQRGFGRTDQDDLEQRLWLAVVNQADRFDPSRASLDTFIDRVVNTAVARILRDRERRVRPQGPETVSLDFVSKDNDRSKQPLAAEITENDLQRRLGVERRDEVADREQAEAVADALGHMLPEVYDVCRRVMAGSISSAASDLETSRRQVRKALAAAQPFLEESGFAARQLPDSSARRGIGNRCGQHRTRRREEHP